MRAKGLVLFIVGLIFWGTCRVEAAQVSAGRSHTAVILDDGTLWTWGDNASGQLGDGATAARLTPTRVGQGADWAAVACGGGHTLAIKTDGSLWAWGLNADGQLGDGTYADRLEPTRIGADADWVSVVAGPYHSYAIKSNRSLWAWGSNAFRQLGNGAERLSAPVKITRSGGVSQWPKAATGMGHIVAIEYAGTLWAWGNNLYGQLGTGNYMDMSGPNQAVSFATTWASVGAGLSHTAGIKSDGSLWIWGGNASGQLGDGTTANRPSPVRVGSDADWKSVIPFGSQTLAIKTDGSLWGWGDNGDGQLGDGTTTQRLTPKRIGSDNDWVAVAGGVYHAVGIKSDGSLWSWGHGPYLGNGTGTSSTAPVRIAAAFANTTLTGAPPAVTNQTAVDITVGGPGVTAYKYRLDGGEWSAERSIAAHIAFGGLSDGAHVIAVVSRDAAGVWQAEGLATTISWTVDTAPPTGTTAVNSGSLPGADAWGVPVLSWSPTPEAAGYIVEFSDNPDFDGAMSRTVAEAAFPLFKGFLRSGTWRCRIRPVDAAGNVGEWGEAVSFTFVSTAGRIAAGSGHTLVIHDDGSLWGFGDNQVGQLGFDSHVDCNVATPIGGGENWTDWPRDWAAVSAGMLHTVAVKTDGSLWGFGGNSRWQLGDGTNADRLSPTRIGQETDWAAVSAGQYFTLALKSDGSLWGWGENNKGVLGDDAPSYRHSPARIGSDADWISVSSGMFHAVAIKRDGSLWAWGGSQWYGQVGDGANIDRAAPTRIGQDNDWVVAVAGFIHTMAIKSDGSLWVWGYNAEGELGDGTYSDRNAPIRVGLANDWVGVAGGFNHTVAIKRDGSLWGWGNNYYGQLGLGKDAYGSKYTLPMPLNDTGGWVDVVVGSGALFTLGLKSDKTLWAFGGNDAGQLGDDTKVDKYRPTRVRPVIAARAFGDGTIDPSWITDVAPGGSQTYTLTPGSGRNLLDTLVDGVSVGPLSSYAFNDVTRLHTIEARYGFPVGLGGAPAALTNRTAFSIAVTDPDVVAYRYRLNGGAWSEPRPAATTLIDLSGLADGTYTLEVLGQHVQGYWTPSDAATSLSFTVDTVAPVATPIIARPPTETESRSATFTIGDSSIFAFRFSLDGVEWSPEFPSGATFSMDDLSVGPHSLHFQSRDAAGNWQRDVTTVSWTVSGSTLAAPTIPSSPWPTANLTTWPTLSWTPVDGATAYLLEVADSADFAHPSVQRTVTGATSYDLAALERLTRQGQWYWRVRAVDASGGLSDWASASFRFMRGCGAPNLLLLNQK